MVIIVEKNVMTVGSFLFKSNTDMGLVSKSEFRFPALPESINFSASTRFMEYEILDLGTVSVPNGKNISTYSWEGILPGEGRKDAPWVCKPWKSPKDIQKELNYCREHGTLLKLKVTGTPINTSVYLADFSMTYTGAFGDYNYSISFIDAKSMEVNMVKAKKKHKRPSKAKSTSYIVKKNDCLWNIALKKLGSGTKYPIIYNANKAMIDKRNKGKNLSKYTIYPGQVLKIPL